MIQVNLSRKRKRNVGREKKEENGRWDGMKEGMEGRRTCRRAKNERRKERRDSPAQYREWVERKRIKANEEVDQRHSGHKKYSSVLAGQQTDQPIWTNRLNDALSRIEKGYFGKTTVFYEIQNQSSRLTHLTAHIISKCKVEKSIPHLSPARAWALKWMWGFT